MRYWSGDIPTRRMKLRRMVSAVPKPHRAAIATTVSWVSSNWRRAASVRMRSTYRPGASPTSSLNTRVK
ncbi:Uncharacterised protein [Mycobacterium tuberculosis]|nr:Uncharacterised protein [Mycobacterium tuberculosis]